MTSSTALDVTKKLLRNIKMHPCIYASRTACSRERFDMAWKEISGAMQDPSWTVQKCKSKWKALLQEYSESQNTNRKHYLADLMSFVEFFGYAGTEGEPPLNIVPKIKHYNSKSKTIATDVRQTHQKEKHWKTYTNPVSPGASSGMHALAPHYKISTHNESYLIQSREYCEKHNSRCSSGYEEESSNQSQPRLSDGFRQSHDSIYCFESRVSTGQLHFRNTSDHRQSKDFTERFQSRKFTDKESSVCCQTKDTIKCHQSRNSEDQCPLRRSIKSHQDTSSSGSCNSSVLMYQQLSDYSKCQQPQEPHSSTHRQTRHSVDCNHSSNSSSSQQYRDSTQYHKAGLSSTSCVLKDSKNRQSSRNSTDSHQSRDVKESKGKSRKLGAKAVIEDKSSAVNRTRLGISIPLFFQSLRPVFQNMNGAQKQKYKLQVLDFLKVKKQRIQ